MECHICHKPLTERFYIDPWDHKMCEYHHDNDAALCSSCNGFTKKDIILPDGRILCSICMSTAVKPGDSVESIKNAVVKALSKVGFDDLRIEDITSIEIVSAGKMAELYQSPTNHRGLTLSRTATSFGLLGGKSQTFQHTIYMLTHLTKIEFAGVLAHEMLHAWQTQNGINMSPKSTEGLCNLGSYLMYQTLASSLTKICLRKLHDDPDPVYGDGFREMHGHLEELGWRDLIKSVRENKFK